MIDPVTALAAATTAFNAIKKGFEVGRDIESMSGDLSRWMGSVSDIHKADEYAKKPPLFKKLFAAGSVEEEAMASFMAKKKAEDMRYQLSGNIRTKRATKKGHGIHSYIYRCRSYGYFLILVISIGS